MSKQLTDDDTDGILTKWLHDVMADASMTETDALWNMDNNAAEVARDTHPRFGLTADGVREWCHARDAWRWPGA